MRLALVSAAGLLLLAASAAADDPVVVDLTIMNHVWMPSESHVPAGRRLVFNVKNLDETAQGVVVAE